MPSNANPPGLTIPSFQKFQMSPMAIKVKSKLIKFTFKAHSEFKMWPQATFRTHSLIPFLRGQLFRVTVSHYTPYHPPWNICVLLPGGHLCASVCFSSNLYWLKVPHTSPFHCPCTTQSVGWMRLTGCGHWGQSSNHCSAWEAPRQVGKTTKGCLWGLQGLSHRAP